MPTSSPAMRAAYERTPSIQRCQEIVLALMTTSTPPGFQGPTGLPPWGHRWTVEDLVLASQEYKDAVVKISTDVQALNVLVNVSEDSLKEAFMNRYGAAVRVLAGHASRKATQEHPVHKVGGRFWALKVAHSELPAPEPGSPSELQDALEEIKEEGPKYVKGWDLAEKTEPPVVNQDVGQLQRDLELLLNRDQEEKTPPVDPPRVDPFEAPAPEPCTLKAPPEETAKAAEPRWPGGIPEEARHDLEMAILAMSESLFSSPAATGENFIPLLHVIYASRKLGLRREAIGELVSSGVQVALRKWEANKAATDKAMREYLADPGEI